MQGAHGLAARVGQIRVKAPAEAAIGIGIAGQCGGHRVGIAVPEEEVEATAIDQPRVSVHEL